MKRSSGWAWVCLLMAWPVVAQPLERTRAPLVAAVKKAFVPVTHTLEIRPE